MRAAMDVSINKDPKWSKIDHFFDVLPKNDKLFPIKAMQHVLRDSGFQGRAEEAITVLADEPRKVTLIGIGDKKKLTMRAVRAAIYAIGKTAKKQRDRSIAVAVPFAIPDLNAADSTRVIADFLAQSDYKYDEYISKKDDDNRGPIDATLIPNDSLDAKRVKQLDEDSRALREGLRIVRDLGNAPAT